MKSPDLRFPSNERLKKMSSFRELISAGEVLVQSPLRITYLCLPFDGESGLRVAFSVSKRRFKKAVDRNRIKRMISEAYRINRIELRDRMINEQKTCHILFHFSRNELPSYKVVEMAMIKILRNIKCG